jgi:beta-lactamase regulating signal transducer with metallopeptidase domain
MSEVIDFLDQLSRLTLEALLNSVWQGAVIAALVWLLLRVMRGASATTRHAVWMVALFTIGVLPFATLPAKLKGQANETAVSSDRPMVLAPATPKLSSAPAALSIPSGPSRPDAPLVEKASSFQQTRPPLRPQPEAAVAPPGVEPTFAISAPPVIEREPRQSVVGAVVATESSAGIRTRLRATLFGGWAPAAILGIWLAVVLLMMTRILRSYASIYQLRRKLSPATPEQQRRVERLAAMFGVQRDVRLYTSPRAPMPMTVGSLNPVIILPPDLARSLSESEFDSITAHELAHIKRWDYLLNLLQRTIQAVLFFHPAVWFIGKQLLIERELACDDWAVKTCEPCSYASCLTRLVESLNKSKPRTAVRLAAAGILFGKHVITRRVEMILNRERNSTTAVSKSTLLYAVGLALSFIVVCSLLQPVIAVPVGQKPAKPRAPKAPKPPTPPAADHAPALPAAPAEPAEFIELPEPPEPPVAIEALPELLDPQDGLPAAPPAAIEDDEIDAPEIAVAPAVAPVFVFTGNPPVPTTPRRAQSPVAVAPAPAPRPEPAVTIYKTAQDDKNRKPAIPEDELISVLSEIVKKDADPAVRSEALQGIYRSRSDAAINSLLGLYDSVSDVKVKGEIIPYLVRREGDNAKAVAKLISIAKTEQNEDLRNRAIRSLGSVKGDEGAANLVQIYDSLQDQKTKIGVIRSLGANKSRKAVDKLIQIAKNDADPNVRMSAIRALNGVDNRIYLDLLDGKRAKIGALNLDHDLNFKFNAPGAFHFDQGKWEAMSDEWRERAKGLFENHQFKEFQNFNFDNFQFDQQKLDEMLKNLDIELPKIRLRLKDIEDGKIIEKRTQTVNEVGSRLAQINAVLNAQLAKQQLKVKANSPELQKTRTMISAIEKELTLARQLKLQQSRASLVAPARAAVARTSVN